MSAIDEVKQKTDIVEVIGQYVTLKKAGRNLTALCPFHSEKNPSFFVYPEQQSWHCFGACNTGGDVFAFIMRKEGLDFGEALRLLAQRVGITLPSRMEPQEKKEEKEEFYKVNDAAALYFNNLLLNHPAAEKARNYVEKRGFSSKTIADFQLGFSLDSWEALKQYLTEKGHNENTMLDAGLLIKAKDGLPARSVPAKAGRTHDRFRGKLMFPIHDIKGRTIGFGARVLDDSLPKYVNSPQTPTFDKSATLYAIDRAAAEIRKQDMAIIMEGYMDVITAHQSGVANAVACMGTAITETQVNVLKKLSRNLVLALDADAAGEDAMLRTVGYENILDAEIRVIVLPEGRDPDDIIKEDINAWKELVSQAVPLLDYMFEKTTASLNLATARDKSLAVDRLLPIVAEINNPVRQAHYLQKLAGMVRVDMNTIKASLSRIKPTPVRRRAPASRPATGTQKPLVSSSREEYLLALLLQNPELKEISEDLSPEYFESSENREIFTAWLAADDMSSLREHLEPAIHEHLDVIINRNLPATRNNIEQRYVDCVMEMRKRYLRSLAARKAEALHDVKEAGADSAWLEEDIKISHQLKELDARKSTKRNPSYTGRARR
jgi:DNA primase